MPTVPSLAPAAPTPTPTPSPWTCWQAYAWWSLRGEHAADSEEFSEFAERTLPWMGPWPEALITEARAIATAAQDRARATSVAGRRSVEQQTADIATAASERRRAAHQAWTMALQRATAAERTALMEDLETPRWTRSTAHFLLGSSLGQMLAVGVRDGGLAFEAVAAWFLAWTNPSDESIQGFWDEMLDPREPTVAPGRALDQGLGRRPSWAEWWQRGWAMLGAPSGPEPTTRSHAAAAAEDRWRETLRQALVSRGDETDARRLWDRLAPIDWTGPTVWTPAVADRLLDTGAVTAHTPIGTLIAIAERTPLAGTPPWPTKNAPEAVLLEQLWQQGGGLAVVRDALWARVAPRHRAWFLWITDAMERGPWWMDASFATEVLTVLGTCDADQYALWSGIEEILREQVGRVPARVWFAAAAACPARGVDDLTALVGQVLRDRRPADWALTADDLLPLLTHTDPDWREMAQLAFDRLPPTTRPAGRPGASAGSRVRTSPPARRP